MAQTFTNQVASQALRGQDVIVTLDSNDALNLDLLSIGQSAWIDSTSIYGVVSFVDYYGTTFHITPLQPDFSFQSPTQLGYLKNGEDVNIEL